MANRALGRFNLVAAAHLFLTRALPLRPIESHAALDTFVEAARRSGLSDADMDAILIRCLRVLSKHLCFSAMPLVEQYLSAGLDAPRTQLFEACVRAALVPHCIDNWHVREALGIINSSYSKADLTQEGVAARLGVSPSALAAAFKRGTDRSFSDWLRETRLTAASRLLRLDERAIKDVWSRVGYNFHSNFAHDFKRRFGCSARAFRARTRTFLPSEDFPVTRRVLKKDQPGKAVLVVDDDHATRETLVKWFRLDGYSAVGAANGHAGLEEYRQRPPSLIVLDFHLGDMDGAGFARRVRSAAQEPPAVIVLSADLDINEYADAFSSMNALLLSKICDFEDIQRAVALVLR